MERAFPPDPGALDEHRRMVRALQRDLNLMPGKRVLEVGGGLGLLSLELASRGIKVVDLDMVPANVDLVSHAARHYELDVTPVYGDSCNLPFGDGRFDGIFCKSVFEHIHNQEAALDEQIRVLRKGGRLMILDGNLLNPFTLADLLFKQPGRSRGKSGGLRWLLTKNKSHPNFGIGWLGKDEDIKTIWWWKHVVRKRPAVVPIKVTTTRQYFYPHRVLYKMAKPFAGDVVILLERTAERA